MKTAQKPAEGIALDRDFGDSVFYTVSCDCGNGDDAIQFNIEYDKDMEQVTMHTYLKLKTDYYTEYFGECKYVHNDWLYSLNYYVASFINGFIRRVKLTWNIWVNGYAEYNSWTLMRQQVAVNYGNAILRAVKEMNK
jgi:hypothetical protein